MYLNNPLVFSTCPLLQLLLQSSFVILLSISFSIFYPLFYFGLEVFHVNLALSGPTCFFYNWIGPTYRHHDPELFSVFAHLNSFLDQSRYSSLLCFLAIPAYCSGTFVLFKFGKSYRPQKQVGRMAKDRVGYTHIQPNYFIHRYIIIFFDQYSYRIVTQIIYPWISRPNPNPILEFFFIIIYFLNLISSFKNLGFMISFCYYDQLLLLEPKFKC